MCVVDLDAVLIIFHEFLTSSVNDTVKRTQSFGVLIWLKQFTIYGILSNKILKEENTRGSL